MGIGHSNVSPDVEFTVVNREVQNKAYEALPVDLRALVRMAPVMLDTMLIYQIWLTHGDKAKGMIEAVFDKEFPSWREGEQVGGPGKLTRGHWRKRYGTGK